MIKFHVTQWLHAVILPTKFELLFSSLNFINKSSEARQFMEDLIADIFKSLNATVIYLFPPVKLGTRHGLLSNLRFLKIVPTF